MKKWFVIIFGAMFFLFVPSLNAQTVGCCVFNAATGICTPNTTQNLCGNSRFISGDASCSSEPRCNISRGSTPGCCILDQTRTSVDPNNCVKNAEESTCQSARSIFERGDLNCELSTPVHYCGGPSAPPQAGGAGGMVSTEFTNPLRFTTVSQALNALIDNLQGIVALISIVFIIVGGVMYMMAGVDEKMVENAKKTITGAVIGFAIILAAPTFLKEIKKILGGNRQGVNADEWVERAFTIKDIALRVVDFLLSVVGVLAIIGLIAGGIFYLTAYGDEDQMKKGKKIITSSIIGIAIALAALVIVRQVARIMGVPL